MQDAGGPVRVVVADDNDETRAVMVQLLEAAEELEVVGAAADVAGALDLAALHRPDALILDRIMPGVAGPTTVDAIRRAAPGVAVVVASGYGRDDPEVAALADAADGYVEKGAPRDALVRAVLRAVGSVTSGSAEEPEWVLTGPRSPGRIAEALHDGPVQALSSALWILDAAERAPNEERRRELLRQLRTTLESSLALTREAMSWAERIDEDANTAR